MDVQHHPQLHHQAKPWKEYLLEGLMIFIAVTLGFFADQLREHFVEIKTEKHYAQSLYDDLKTDTLVIQRTADEKGWIYAKFDSAEAILAAKDISKNNNNEFIYYIEKYIYFNDVFTSQDVTYQQLKSSGGFRYLKNIELYKKLADYYNLYSRYQSIDGSFGNREGLNQTTELESKIFNASELSSLDNSNADNFYDLALRPDEKKFEPISTDKQTFNLLYLKINDAKRHSFNSKLFLGWLKGKAIDILSDLKKEYHLE